MISDNPDDKRYPTVSLKPRELMTTLSRGTKMVIQKAYGRII